jgi:dihydroorotate dehydrogenase (fumarate)
MDLSTTCMGLRLRTPIVAGASPLGDDLDDARRLEDRGAGALVMRSVFAEQLRVPRTLRSGVRRSSLLGDPLYEGAFVSDPEDYLRHLGRLKEALSIPVFASLNGASPGPWLEFASALGAAGADGIELNLYALATDPRLDGRAIESAALDVVREVKARSSVPVAVKITPYFTALAHFARQLADAGANALVLFGRPFQEDIDASGRFVKPGHQISRVTELELRLRWLGVLSAIPGPTLVASGGVHDGQGVVKSILAGAHAVQMVSAVLARGPVCISEALGELSRHLARGGGSVAAIRGTLDLRGFPDPAQYERLSYMVGLQRWRGGRPATT